MVESSPDLILQLSRALAMAMMPARNKEVLVGNEHGRRMAQRLMALFLARIGPLLSMSIVEFPKCTAGTGYLLISRYSTTGVYCTCVPCRYHTRTLVRAENDQGANSRRTSASLDSLPNFRSRSSN